MYPNLKVKKVGVTTTIPRWLEDLVIKAQTQFRVIHSPLFRKDTFSKINLLIIVKNALIY